MTCFEKKKKRFLGETMIQLGAKLTRRVEQWPTVYEPVYGKDDRK